ncbi:MAG: nucleoside hydrolase [Nocardioidaceae bacterium]
MSTARHSQRLHLDTDFAGDPDDACALAMVLGWPGLEVVGITTTADPDGRRAGYVAHVLAMLGCADIPLAVGAEVSGTTGRAMGAIPDHERFWGTTEYPPPRPRVRDAAVDLLDASIERGATIAAIGPYTNLADLERARPGRLADARVVVMGGWLDPLGPQFPAWGPSRDWNVVCDLDAAETVASRAGELTWVTIPGTISAQLRGRDLPRLQASGPLGRLLARQSLAHGEVNGLPRLADEHAGLHSDLVNFHWDPVACAVALGWEGARLDDVRVRPERRDGAMPLIRSPHGRQARVVVDVDGEVFTECWSTAVEAAQRAETRQAAECDSG